MKSKTEKRKLSQDSLGKEPNGESDIVFIEVETDDFDEEDKDFEKRIAKLIAERDDALQTSYLTALERDKFRNALREVYKVTMRHGQLHSDPAAIIQIIDKVLGLDLVLDNLG